MSVSTVSASPNIKRAAKKLSAASAPDSYKQSHEDITWHTFAEWLSKLQAVSDPDEARFVLYYGFQPLYDALLEGRVNQAQRTNATAALAAILESGTKYLTGYYLGDPNVATIRALSRKLPNLLPDCAYETKFRNVDYNGVTAHSIHTFLLEIVSRVLDESLPAFDSVVGCACGAAEVVMPLAGIFGTPLHFLRRSWRRGDDSPRVIEEHASLLHDGLGVAACVEDYVCSGKSLGRVMKHVKKCGATEVIGLSVCGGEEPTAIKRTAKAYKFRVYSL